MSKRAKPEIRKDEILTAAIPLAEEHGFANVTRNMIADSLGVAPTTVQYHFGTMTTLRKEIVRRAVKSGNLSVIAQAVAAKHTAVQKIEPELKQAALAAL